MACPLVDCKDPQVSGNRPPDGSDGEEFDCPRCGHFILSGTLAASDDFAKHPELMEGLRSHIRAENARGRVPILAHDLWQVEAGRF